MSHTTTDAPVTAGDARAHMIEALTASGALRSSRWMDAFAAIPREVFAGTFQTRSDGGLTTHSPDDADYLTAVYDDTSLITQWDAGGTATSSSSQPSVMARMLEALAVPPSVRVAEIGTGTGYNTALLCHGLGDDQVVSIDVDPVLTAEAREKLAEVGYAPTLVTADATRSLPGDSPYGGVLATCGLPRIPAAWLHRVTPGGVIVANTGTGIVRLTVATDHSAHGPFLPDRAAFMTARPTAAYVAPHASQFMQPLITATGETRTVPLPEHAAEVLAEPLLGMRALEVALVHDGVLAMSWSGADGVTVHGLAHPRTGAWARITPVGGAEVEVMMHGPRDLWQERLDLLTGWIEAGRPGPGCYSLTVDADGQHTLRRGDPAAPCSWTL